MTKKLREQIVKILEQHTNSNLASSAARDMIADEILLHLLAWSAPITIHNIDVSDMKPKAAFEFIKNYRKGISNEK